MEWNKMFGSVLVPFTADIAACGPFVIEVTADSLFGVCKVYAWHV